MSTLYDEKLLDKVGLAMVPSGYTNNAADEGNTGGALGKVYSVLPIQTTSNNLVINGDFSDGSTGWDLSIGSAVITNGVAEWPDTTNSFVIKPGIVERIVKTYILTYTVKTSNQGSLSLGGGSSAFGAVTLPNKVGTHTLTLTSNGTTTNLQFFNNSSFVGTIDDISLVKVIDGDFDFSRGSDATRVNSQGYIESVQVLSDELVQNGDFEEVGSELVVNGDWYVHRSAAFEIIGNLIYIENSGNTYGGVEQFFSVSSNKSFQLKYEVIEGTTSTDWRVDVGSFQGGTDLYSKGQIASFLENTVITSTTNEIWIRVYNNTPTIGDNFSIDNISLVEVGQNWTFTNATINNGEAVLSPAANLNQNCGLINGKKYRINYDITSISAGTSGITAYAGSTGAGTTRTEIGTYTEDIVASGALLLYFFTGGGFVSGTIDNISVKEVTDDTDIPRLDYTNAACPSLLLEPQRRNILPYSEDFTQWDTTGTAPVLTSGFSSPSNGIDAYHLAAGVSGSNVPNAIFDFPSFPRSSSTTYTFSVFAKKGEYKNIFLRAGASDGASITFDLDTFEFIQKYEGVAPITDYSITQMRDGWAKICFSYTTADTSPNFVPNIMFYPDSGVTIDTTGCYFAGDGVSGGYIYGAQLEDDGSLGAASHPTSYIPTNGTTITRLADICNNAGDSTIFNDSEGVLFLEARHLADETTDSIFRIRNSSNTSEFVDFRYDTTVNRIQMVVQTGAVLSTTIANTDYNDKVYNKIALKYKQDDFAIWINGKEAITDPSGGTPTGLNEMMMFIGQFNAAIRQVIYFNEALSDAELEYITSADIDLTIHNYKGSLSKISATYEDVGVKDRLTKLF